MFIFAASSGRVGTKYLCHILGTASNSFSYHEPDPQMNGKYVDLITSHSYIETYEQRKEAKIPILKKHLSEHPDKVYCETSHMFIKTYFDIVLDEFKEDVQVIILRRDLPNTLKSLVEMGLFGGSPSTPIWMVSPNAATAAIKCIANDDDLDQIDKCIAYLIDTEARIQRMRKKYPNILMHEVNLNQLNDLDFVSQLFEKLGLQISEFTASMIGKVTNRHTHAKSQFSKIDVSVCTERIHKYISRASQLRINIPILCME
jgi:hypothetical protein